MPQVDLKSLFSGLLPAEQILSQPQDLAFYGKDVCHEYQAAPGIVLRPGSLDEIRQILALCHSRRIAVVPSGGRTGYSGGATAQNGEVLLSLERLNKILQVNTLERTVTCQAGVTTEALRQAVSQHGLFYPVDFASKGSSHIGGNIATNAGGIRVVRYGTTRDWVLGLKAVSASGEDLDLNGPLFKNASGYDLRNLIVGSEGTLAVVVEATLKLTAPPGECALVLCALEKDHEVLPCLEKLRRENFCLNVFEYFERKALEAVLAHNALKNPFANFAPYYLLIEIETPAHAERERFESVIMRDLESGIFADAVIAHNSKQYVELLSLRELIGSSINRHYFPYKNDISVPISAITDFMRELKKLVAQRYPDFDVIVFGHIGDGNLHINIIKPEGLAKQEFLLQCEEVDRAMFTLIQSYSGSISAEHGVGLLKKPYLAFCRSKLEIELMRGIKRVFDPHGILNPGKIFDL